MMELLKEECLMFKEILREEMVTALGCTEPIAIAYASAKARETLGRMPERIEVECSGNLIKNAKAVVVPMTVDMKGIQAAALIGAVGGDASKKLEVLTGVTETDIRKAKELLEQNVCAVKYLDTPEKLHMIVRSYAGSDEATVEILHVHTGIVRIEKNGTCLWEIANVDERAEEGETDRGCLTMEKIYAFAKKGDFEGLTDMLDHAIEMNMAISEEGLANPWGAQVGRTLLETRGNDVRTRAIASAAAGSDARMSGCELGVVINSGSGNQGITVTTPVVTYGLDMGAPKEELYAALAFANLTGIHQKAKIGRLSAFCGAVSAGCAAACGIAFLKGEPLEVINQIIVNALGNTGGVVCDGAKPSCAAKIATSLEAGLLGFEMAKRGRGFKEGEGLIKKDIEETIDSFCRMAKYGMQSTDEEILRIMVEC